MSAAFSLLFFLPALFTLAYPWSMNLRALAGFRFVANLIKKYQLKLNKCLHSHSLDVLNEVTMISES
jgi:hypothetical protein